MRQAGKLRAGEISQAAVARVIVDYLKVQGTLDAGDDLEYRKLKDRVYRALAGKAMTPDTLAWFTCAFVLTREDARQVWAGFTGARPDQVDGYVSDLLIPPPQAAAFAPLGFETKSLHETHEIGIDRRPIRHHVKQQIQATEEWGWRYPVRFSWKIADFDVINGSGAKSELYRCEDNLYAVDIILPRPVRKGETTVIEYELTLDPANPDDGLFQRVALPNMRDIVIKVCFSPKRSPRTVWWAHWREIGSDTPPYLREQIEFDPESPSVQKRLTCAEHTIVGFCWQWPED
jgi:hypothetical protein